MPIDWNLTGSVNPFQKDLISRETLNSSVQFWLHKPYLRADWYRVSAKRLRKLWRSLAGNQQVTNIPLDRVESVEIVFRTGEKIFAVFFDFVNLETKWCIWLTLNFHRISLRGEILWLKWDRQNIPQVWSNTVAIVHLIWQGACSQIGFKKTNSDPLICVQIVRTWRGI